MLRGFFGSPGCVSPFQRRFIFVPASFPGWPRMVETPSVVRLPLHPPDSCPPFFDKQSLWKILPIKIQFFRVETRFYPWNGLSSFSRVTFFFVFWSLFFSYLQAAAGLDWGGRFFRPPLPRFPFRCLKGRFFSVVSLQLRLLSCSPWTPPFFLFSRSARSFKRMLLLSLPLTKLPLLRVFVIASLP